ncbi:HupE/UreJ family protein [Oxalobacteraceae bacterium]|nr:HupE/UreJ family protein [Oxalobacteraceae bacterium]
MKTFRLLLCTLLVILAAPAHAHKPSDSYLTLSTSADAKSQQLEGRWDIALRDLDYAIGLDSDGDGQLTWDEVRSRHADIAAYALARLQISTDAGTLPANSAQCTVKAAEQLLDRHTDGTYTVLRFHASCPANLDSLQVNYRLFADLDPQHRGLLRIEQRDAGTITAILGPDQPQQRFTLGSPNPLRQFLDYVRHGTWHIWIGADHILFLLSLLLPAVLPAALPAMRRLTSPWPREVHAAGAPPPAAATPLPIPTAPALSLRAAFIDVLKVVTAFTLAHSLTLTLASLSLLSLPSRWVESAIAASVVIAALNNIWPLFPGRRPLAAFVFGLIHGFGFASVLADLGLPQGTLLMSLFGFNLGVELGQLAIVAAFLPCAFLLRRSRVYRGLLTGGSALIALLAGVWLVERAFDLRLLPL